MVEVADMAAEAAADQDAVAVAEEAEATKARMATS